MASLLPYALFAFLQSLRALGRGQGEGLSLGAVASRGDQQGRAASRSPLHKQPAWPGLQPGRESLSLSQKFSSKGFPAPPLQQ